MRRLAWLLLSGVPCLLGAQGFGVYEHNACTMGRAGVAAASPCPDGSAIFYNPAGLAGLSGFRASGGVTLIHAQGDFTDDLLAHKTSLDNPTIPVPDAYVTYAATPALTFGIGLYAPYGLETRWPINGFDGRFIGYDTNIRSLYVQPTVAYQVTDWLKVGVGVAYIHSWLELHQRVDLATESPSPGVTFESLGVPRGTDFADVALKGCGGGFGDFFKKCGNGFAVNFGGIIKVNDKLSIGGHWLTKKTIKYDGTATFDQILTGLTLAPNNPLGLPGGTPLDALLTPEFQTGGPLADGGVSTSIIMPPQGSIGFAYKLREGWTLMADYQYVVWGWFKSIVIDFANPGTPQEVLSPNNKDSHGIRVGTEYQASPKLSLRGGYLYHTAASPDEFVTPLLPEAPRNEFTAGLGYQLANGLHADLAYQYIAQQDRRGRVFPEPIGNTGLYTFSAHLFGVGLAYTF
jgi:long-chain fatty acid transport protein